MEQLSRRIATSIALALGLSTSIAASAGTIVLETEIVSMSLTGTGAIPLASDPANALGDSIDGYGFVDSAFTATESLLFSSSATTIWDLDPLTGDSQLTAAFTLFLDLELTDVDDEQGRDYAGQTHGAKILLPAVGAMTYSQTASLDVFGTLDLLLGIPNATEADLWAALMNAIILGTPSSTQAVYALGQDINANGVDDVLKLKPTDISVDPTNLDYELISGDLDTLVDALSAVSGSPPAVFQASVGVESTNAVFSGDVLDAISDPPFTIGASGSFSGSPNNLTNGIPEPSTGLLFAVGGLALLAMRRRSRTP